MFTLKPTADAATSTLTPNVFRGGYAHSRGGKGGLWDTDSPRDLGKAQQGARHRGPRAARHTAGGGGGRDIPLGLPAPLLAPGPGDETTVR